jgi:predicted O-methyltransferase YrrM
LIFVTALFTIRSFITYWLDAVDDHSIHSPFFFEFYNVVQDKTPVWGADEIEDVRTKLLNNPFPIEVTEMGSGTQPISGKEKLSDIALRSLAPKEMAELYARIVKYLKAESIVELGTSLGITTLYLALRNETQVVTLEGNKASADIALTNFEFFDKRNISVVHGNIDKTLKEALFNIRKVDFVLIDANHRYEPTMRYFDLVSKRVKEKSVVIIDDIHRSPEMAKAWNEIIKHDLVYGSIDLFRCGILFFEPSLGKQHFVWELPWKMVVGKR